VVFPSPASIAIVLDAAAAAGLEWPARAAIALVGPGSREELARWHDRVPGLADAACIEPPSGPYDAAALLSHPALQRLDGCRVVALRRVDGSRDWIDALRRRGAQVEDITAYRVHAVDPPAGAAAWMAACRLAGQGLAVSVGSAEAGRRLAQWASHLVEPDGDWLLAQPVLTVHPRIASALEAAGWRWIVQHAPGMAGLLGAVESVRSDTP
jgi:uroporphyrinogen-III synthase